MDVLWNSISLGFSVAVSPENLLLALLGCLLGTLIGVLPGIGPLPTIAILLPLTFNMSPEGSLIMLAGIFYGAQYGGSTTAILLRIPGESTSVVTTLDGHAMAQQGRAGAALAIAAIASFIAGCIATAFIAVVGLPMSRMAQAFGPPEYFVLLLVGLLLAAVLGQGSRLRALLMVGLGLILATIGTDIETGQQRFTAGITELWDGIGFVPMAIGLLGITELLRTKETKGKSRAAIGGLLPSGQDLRAAINPTIRGTFIGGILGVLPGSGAILAPFASYAAEKRISAAPEKFGKGAVAGLAGPEAANNAAAQTSFIPLLTLGIPPNGIMALMLGAMMIQGIVPGPQVINSNPELFWGVIVSMWIGNLMLLVLNLPLVGLWVQLLKLPQRFLTPSVVVFSCIGVYTINNSAWDVFLACAFGALGLWLVRLNYEPAPLILGFVLGGPLEEKLRQSLILSRGDPLVFLTRPVSGAMLAVLVAVLLGLFVANYRRRRLAARLEH